jgi:hypothetical protein
LRECALGYRAKNLLATARLVSSGEANLEAWSPLSDVDLRTKLCALPGVGSKIANCVMLFGYERLHAFPIDVWIERVLKEKYFPRARKVSECRLRTFSEEYFGEYGGYAQQYLFHHARTASRKSETARDFSTALRSGRNDKKGNARTGSRKSAVERDSSTTLRRSTAALRASAQGSGFFKQGDGAGPERSRNARNDNEGARTTNAPPTSGGRGAVRANNKPDTTHSTGSGQARRVPPRARTNRAQFVRA